MITDRKNGVEVAFVGRSQNTESSSVEDIERGLTDAGLHPPKPWVTNRQVHSNRVVEAKAGSETEADGLWTERADCSLFVVTADCVPILLAGSFCIAAVHAGWRGLASRVLANAIREQPEDAAALSAWIGPAMRGCCYEVSEEVASAVASASGPGVVLHPPHSLRPHLDLQTSARLQLAAAGVRDISVLTECTGCKPDQWWSHRRGADGRRNHSLIWRS